jgi:prolyl-tRNA synthetase
MRFSNFFIITKKEAPKSALLSSHIFLLKAGFISQTGSGIYDMLPLGKITLQKIKDIVKNGLDSAGNIEVQLGLVTPIAYWESSDRASKYGKELLRFKDRKSNEFVFSPTN